MRQREFIGLLGGGAAMPLFCPLAARAQQPMVWRIGILETISSTLNAANLNALRLGLRDLGYVEGRNLILEYRSADGLNERFPELAKELLGHKVDLIVTRGTPAALAVKNATATVPVVMVAVGEPLMIVKSLSRPGGNATGLSSFVTELQAKRLEVLRDTLPAMVRVGVLLNMSNPVTPPQWAEFETAARKLGIAARLFDVRTRADLPRALEGARGFGAHAVMVGTGALLQDNAKLIAELAVVNRLPTMHVSREWVEAGGLITYGPSYPDLYRRSGSYVDKIFKGDAPGSLPVQQPTKFEMTINLKTAKALGLIVPPTLLARADEVIE
jgi:putative ABC transport system substrate-binding protein